MNIKVLRRQGLSLRQIARRLGLSRNTVKKYLTWELPWGRAPRAVRPGKLTPYLEQLGHWLEEDSFYQATKLYGRLRQLGYQGSYSLVKRKVSALKERLTRKAYEAFETEPGRQAQVDFGEFQVEGADGTVAKYYVFAMILGFSRRLYAELIERCDLVTFLDCHIRAFGYFGGVPAEILYDRMRNVFIRQLAGRTEFTSGLMSLAAHYGFKPLVAPAYAAWVKGKVERPIQYLRESFWRGYAFQGLETASRDLRTWLRESEQRVHGTTHERVDERFLKELPVLGALPLSVFDTAERIYRTVHKDCVVHFECNRYVVPHTLVNQEVTLRVKDRTLRIYAEGSLVVTYRIPEGKGHLIQDPRFYQALRVDAEQNRRKYQVYQPHKGRAKQTISPLKPRYDLDVMIRPLTEYEAYGEAV